MFGFGGLYLVKGGDFDYSFQRIVNSNITIPNFDSKYTISAVMVTHGDSILIKNNITEQQNKQLIPSCTNEVVDNSPKGAIDLKAQFNF
jgi:hypothetical protein